MRPSKRLPRRGDIGAVERIVLRKVGFLQGPAEKERWRRARRTPDPRRHAILKQKTREDPGGGRRERASTATRILPRFLFQDSMSPWVRRPACPAPSLLFGRSL